MSAPAPPAQRVARPGWLGARQLRVVDGLGAAQARAPAPAPAATARTGRRAAPAVDDAGQACAPAPKARASNEAPEAAAPPEPAPATVSSKPLLRVAGDVAGADVFVDRIFVGKTPFETRDITAGSHQINVSAEGYRRDVATGGGGRPRAHRSDLLAQGRRARQRRAGRAQAPARVVRRAVAASPAGCASRQTSGDDAFQAPLTGLETLAVNYEEKELRLKLKGGKNFTFTTRADNADPLVVFHRDVEKARKKLAGGA